MRILIYVLITSNILTILFVIRLKVNARKNKLLIEKENKIKAKENNIIEEILELGINQEFTEVERSANVIIKALRKYYKIDYCTVLINDNNKLICNASNAPEGHLNDIEEYCNKLFKKLNRVAKIGYSERCLDYKTAAVRMIKYYYIIPLMYNKQTVGAIYIENKDDYKEINFESEFYKIIIKNITVVLRNCLYQDQRNSLAMKDNLTKIFNRNYMESYINSLLVSKREFCLAIMDIDHFKHINDTYGHDFGDIVLKELSDFVKNNLNLGEKIYRWGGEEFIISFESDDISYVERRLNEIREQISFLKFSNGKQEIKVTASFGIARNSGESLSETIKAADEGLYQSKNNGRNKVTVNAGKI